MNDENFNNPKDYTIDGGHNTSKVLHHSVAYGDITYYYKVRAETSDSNIHSDWEDSNIVSIVIKAMSIPAVSTQGASEIGKYSVFGNGNLININGPECTELGFEIGESQSDYELKLCSGSSFNTGTYSLKIEELKGGTKYYIRAYASNGMYIGRGYWREFTTLPDPVVYRAYLVGISDYIYNEYIEDLPGPTFDVDKMKETLENCGFGVSNTIFTPKVYVSKDKAATEDTIRNNINLVFNSADSNDVSFFYFAGHARKFFLAAADYKKVEYNGEITRSGEISLQRLQYELNSIPGIKVVILDACYSGSFIDKSKKIITMDDYISFNDEVINIFSHNQQGKYLTNNNYVVLTSCTGAQVSGGYDPWFEDPYSVFTKALVNGCGYDDFTYPYPADSDKDGKVSIYEAFLYIKNWVDSEFPDSEFPEVEQDVQMSSDLGDDFPIVEVNMPKNSQ